MKMLFKQPLIALTWECWRLSRRWYLWVLLVAIAGHVALMNLTPRNPGAQQMDQAVVHQLIADGVLMLGFSLAVMTTLLAGTMGGKAGFPLSFEYRLPIRTSALVAVPMTYLAVICASLYVVPMSIGRLLYDVPFPLMPAAALLATLVVGLLACAWSTTTTIFRTFLTFTTLLGFSQLYEWLDPIDLNASRSQPGLPTFNPDIFTMDLGEYGVLAVVCLLLFGVTLLSIKQQRKGEAPTLNLLPLLRTKTDGVTDTTIHTNLASKLLEWATDLVKAPCPVSSPIRAELWLELKRHVIPILLISTFVAMCVPVLYIAGITPAVTGLNVLDYGYPLAVFFTGIAIAIFNRRLPSSGFMSAFEGTRGMSTTTLALIQLLSVAGSTFMGIILVCLSVSLSSMLLDEPGALAIRLETVGAALVEHGPLLLSSEAVTLLVAYIGIVAFYACLQVVSVVWGRWFLYAMMVVALYGIFTTVLVFNGDVGLKAIQNQMWGFALVVVSITVVALGKTLVQGLLSPRAAIAAVLCWGIFLAGSLYSLAHRGIVLPEQAAELQAMNASLLLLPLTMFVLLNWGYDRLRHR